MYRVLIVDNEPIIVDQLFDILNTRYGDELELYRAYSSREAAQTAECVGMDILLTDISMPDMNGIELAQCIRRNSPLTRVIFLTAHSSFEYAKSAVNCGVVEYILKSEGDSSILSAMDKALSLIKQEWSLQGMISGMNERINALLPAYTQEFLNAQLLGIGHSTAETERFLRKIRIGFDAAGLVRMVLCRHGPELSDMEVAMLAAEVFKKYMGEDLMVLYTRLGGLLVWLLQPPVGAGSTERLKNACFGIQRTLREDTGCEASFVIAGEGTSWSELPSQFDTLSRLAARELDCEIGAVVVDDQSVGEPQKKFGFNETRVRQCTELLKLYLEELQRDAYFRTLGELIALYPPGTSLHYLPAVEGYLRVIKPLIEAINRMGIDRQISFRAGIGPMLNLSLFDTWQDVFGQLHGVAGAVFSCERDKKRSRMEVLVAHVKESVISDPGGVSLVTLADEFGSNPSYLSRVFKQVENIGLHDFITQCRLDKAKVLLLSSDKRIYDVARECGWETGAYFAKVFKAGCGMPPQEYREKYGLK